MVIVEQLIEELKQYHQDLRVAVVVDGLPYDIEIWGYENIFCDEKAVTITLKPAKEMKNA